LGMPAFGSGCGYDGPLAYRMGKPMRPDVAAAFDRMAAAAREEAGLFLSINSAFRSDAEQARLFAANPNPKWVAPPGTSLHRYATELDLGPPAAYAWLAANARRFGFIHRYAWEPWHYGFGPNPRDRQHPARFDQGSWEPPGGDHGRVTHGLPSFVPSRFHDPIARAALRWNVPMNVLAAQLYAESGFNPFAQSPAGAEGIAQFMPGTADAYGLENPFDPVEAIDAQAHLMSDLLRQFEGKVALALAGYNAGAGAVERYGGIPPYAETRAYVTKILGLLGGAGEIPIVGGFEVRLVE
jgi:Transglycosylase SLT domain/D-alanyl-D-alanine carboxypeptidase